MEISEVERLLRRAAAATEYPPTPDLAPALVSVPRLRPIRPALVPSLAMLALVLGLALFAALAAVRPAREGLARFFGVEGSRIERLPGRAISATPAGLQAVATPVSLAEARSALAAEPALPVGFGAPRALHVLLYDRQPVLVAEYERFDLWQATLPSGAFFVKGLPPGLVLREVTVAGRPAYWMSGGSHFVRFVDAQGREAVGSVRTVERNTLVWNGAVFFYRLETDLSLEEALRIAESLP